MYYLGVDIGGTTIKAGLVNEAGTILRESRVATAVDDLGSFLASLAGLIRTFEISAIGAIGIGVPGLRNRSTRVVVTSPNIPCLTNVSLEALVADEVHLPVVTENDANAAAYAEFACGVAKGLQHFAYLTLGTGLGSGVILDGKLFTGKSGYAVEFGHHVVDADGRPCGCGNRGCLETLVSGPGIVQTALELMRSGRRSLCEEFGESLTAEKVYDAAENGDRVAQETLERTGRWLGLACSNLINMLNLEMILLGGGVMAAGNRLLDPAVDEARRRAIRPSFEDCRIVQSTLWPHAGLIGAAMLARDRAR